MILLHGTSADALKSILAGGFKCADGDIKRNWKVSGNYTYFWRPSAFADEWEEPRQRWLEAFRCAAGSAEMALVRAVDCRRAVIEVEIDSEYVMDDNSCPNMEQACRVRSSAPVKILRYWLDEYPLDFYRAYFATLYFNLKYDPLSLKPMGLGKDPIAAEINFTEAENALVKCLIVSEDMSTIFEYLSDSIYQMDMTEVAKPSKKYTIQFDLGE